MAEIHVGDFGTFLRWTISDGATAVDMGPATTKQVKFVKPDATSITKNLVFSTKIGDSGDGSDGRVEYVLASGDIDQSGTWSWQIYIVMPSWTGHSDTGTFTVSANI